MKSGFSTLMRMICGFALISAFVPVSALVSDDQSISNHSQARMVQGQFDSEADQSSFQQALAKAFGGEVKIENPAADPVNGDGATNDRFGWSVAVSGDTAVVGVYLDDVGANANQGSAFVFTRSGSAWSQQAKLTAGDGTANDWFGYAVALSGDTALVGAPLDDIGAQNDRGSAYVFTRSGSAWSQQARLSAGDGAANDWFGNSVSLAGETAVVGAQFDDIGANANQGSAYVFTRSGSTWSEQAKLSASDGAASDEFGYAVAVSGDTTVVGAPNDLIGANDLQGSGYVFIRSGSTWSEQAKLTAGDGAAFDQFGWSVAISGDTAVVGARWDDIGANFDQGSAYVFTRSLATWSEQAKLTAGDGGDSDEFGFSVAVSGDTAVVGAYLDDIGANTDQGSAYVFTRSLTTWSQETKLSASNGAADDQFGYSVAVSGDTAVVGAYFKGIGANANQGSAYAFGRSAGIWSEQAMLTSGDGASNDEFGYAVAVSGDTALVGVRTDDIGVKANQGSAYVFLRSGNGWSQQAKLTAGDGAAGDQFGYSVALSGDTAVVGAYQDDLGASNQGSAYVFTRSGSVWSEQAKLSASDGATNDWFGFSVALDGDTAVVGANSDDFGASANQGSAFVFTRSNSIWGEQAKLSATAGAAGDQFGVSVAVLGDTAVVGAPFDDIGFSSNQGSATVFVRSGTTWSQQAVLIASDGAASDGLGWSVAVSGGTAVIGAYLDDIGANADQGSAYVFTRSLSSWSQQAKLSASDGAAGDQFGWSVALDGDTAVVGARLDAIGANSNQGSAWSFTRSLTTWSEQTMLSASDGAAQEQFGFSVALSGDTAVVGASSDDSTGATGNPDVGSIYIYRNTPTVTPSAGSHGSISPSTPQTVPAGQTLSFTVTPDVGYSVSSVTGCGGTWSGSNPYVTAAINANCTVMASFVINQYTLSFDSQGGSSVSSITQDFTSTVTVPAAPTRNGYTFLNWNAASDGSGTSYAPGATFAMPANNQTLFAIWTNNAPSMSSVSNQTVLEDALSTTITVTVSDAETDAASLLLSATSSQPALVPVPIIGGTANPAERSLSFTPAPNANGGPVTITLTLTDGPGASSQSTFTITVTPVNDQPALTLGTTIAHPAATSGAQSLANFASVDFGPADEDASQAVDDFVISLASDPNGILAAVDIANDGTLNYTLTGVGGVATINAQVRDNGGNLNNGADTSNLQQFNIEVALGADLQIAKTNDRTVLLDGETTLFAIVVANAGPNAVSGATLTDNLPGTLINASWMCLPAQSTATCPTPNTGSGNISASIDLGVNQHLRFDVLAEVDGAVNAFVTNTASVAAPLGITSLDASNDSATDSDPIVPMGIFGNGFEAAGGGLTVPAAQQAIR